MLWLPVEVALAPYWFTYFIFTFLMILATSWFIKLQRKVWIMEPIPGPKALPILGNALELRLDNKALFQRFMSYCDYGEVARVWIGPYPYVLLSGARAVEEVLRDSKILDKSPDYNFLHPWLGKGLLTSTGQKWHSRRKLLTPAFHFKILEDFMDIFNSQSFKMVQKLREKADGTQFDIFPYVTRCTLDVICESAMGTPINAQDETDSEYIKAIYKISELTQQRVGQAWQHPDLIYKLSGCAGKRDSQIKILHNFSLKTIRERRKKFEEKKAKVANGEVTEANGSTAENDLEYIGKKKNRLAFLDLLLEYSQDGQALTDEDIREEVDTFMFEGHDTTTSAINFSLYLLGLHPEIQVKVHEELDSIFGDSDRSVTSDDVRELKYLENCIKEALRIYPAVPIYGRENTKEIMLSNYRIPPGTAIYIINYRLHRDPEQFPNPDVYDPDRFLPENSKNRHPYAYIPFSAGPRNCIGQKFALMEEKVILSNILRQYRVKSCIPRNDLEVMGELILRPVAGNQIKLFPRTSSIE
ncbi:Cytochrome P450 4V2 [Halocaridina rubra]|uniref:Cytochrome P450 4V2 n=1 Tax=Halocaridina rubra TaxID=373956 RepID=A0AAN9AB09_HALRR